MKTWMLLVCLSFQSLLGQKEIQINWDFSTNLEGLSIDQCKFFVGDFIFYRDGAVVANHPDFILIEKGKHESVKWVEDEPTTFDSFVFTFGVDSLTHEKGVMTGDLDPVNGMYWAWQSGYIDLKLEGSWKNQPIQFHLGGYQYPYRADQKVKIRCSKGQSIFTFPHFLDQSFLEQLNTMGGSEWRIMSPQAEAVKWMKWFASKMEAQ